MTITTAQAGNFSAATTWTGGVVPRSGDSVTLNHATVWDASFSGIAGMTINANVTTSGTGLTFGFGANAAITQGTIPNVNVAIGAGNTVAGVQGSPFVWTVSHVYAPGAGMWLQFNGTTSSHCAVRDGRFTWDGVNGGGGVVRPTFTDFLRCGDATHPAITFYQVGYLNPIQIYDCTFDACGAFANTSDVNGVDTIDVRRSVWKNTPSGVYPISLSVSTARTTGVRNVIGCVFDQAPRFYNFRDFTITDNVFWNGYIGLGGRAWASFQRNLCRVTATGSSNAFAQQGDVADSYFWCDGNQANPHFVVPDGTLGSLNLDGSIFDVLSSDAQGDCWLGFSPPGVPPAVLTLNQGSTYTSDAAPPYHLLGAAGTVAVNDAYYFGWSASQQSTYGTPLSLTLLVATPAAGTFTLAWEYWNGTAWTALPGLADPTSGLTVAGRNVVSWTTPAGWTSTTVNGVAASYVRARVATLTSLTTSPSIPQLVMTQNAQPTVTYKMTRCIVPPGRDGNDVGTLMTLHGNLNTRFIAEHNTYSPGVQAAAFGESYNGYPGMIASFRGNLAWNPAPGNGFKVWDSGHGGTSTGVVTDVVAPASADYNGGFNLLSTYTPGSPTWLTNQGNSYVGAFSATPGAHDVNGLDPNFVDGTRNSGTWDASLGGDGTSAHLLAQFQAKNPAYTVANLIAYVRAGFVPQNAAYQNASYPGDPLMADIGAMAVSVPTVASYTIAGPSPANGTVGTPSGAFTVTLGIGTLPAPVVITPSDGGAGGAFSPATLTLTNTTRSGTFTYTPGSSGVKTIGATNGGGLTNPQGLSFSAAASGPPGYTLAGPLTLDVGVAGAFTITTNVAPGAAVTFTPNDSGRGGTFTPATITIAAGGSSSTFTYTPASPGAVAVAATNNGGLPDAPGRSYIVTSFGLYRPTWEANMASMRAYYLTLASPAPIAPLAQDNHYDPLEVWEAVRRYTGDAATYDPCVAAALYQQRDSYELPLAGSVQGWAQFTQGPRDHYVRTGDRLSRAATILQSVNCIFAAETTALDYNVDQSNSRPCAFAIMSYLDAEDCGAAHRPRLDHYVRLALGHCDQWLTPEANWTTGQFLQPFMVGITLRSLIAYYDRYRESGVDATVTPNVNITGIPAKVKAMLDLMWTGSHGGVSYWYPDQRNPGHGYAPGAGYPVGPAGTGAFGYYYPPTVGEGDSSPSAILNMFLAPAFYWYWWYTSAVLGAPDDAYRQRGDAVFSGAMACVAGAFSAGAQKEFNENYLWSTHGVAWRDRTINPPTAATAVALTGPASLTGPANVPSGLFAVALSPGSVVANPVTVTPVVPGGGRAIPARVVLTTDRPKQVFRVVPAAGSAGSNVTISVGNNGGLTNPAGITYTVGTAVALATAYTISVPASLATGPHLISDPFTAALSPAGSVPGPTADSEGGMIRITHGDGYSGGQFNPGCSWLSAEQTTTPYTYSPVGPTPRTVITGNWIGFSDPAGVAFTPSASDYTLTPPSPAGGPIGSASGPFTLALAHGSVPVNATTNLPGVVPVALADGGSGGTFSASTVNLTNAAPSASAAYTPTSAGVKTITATSTGGFTDPPAASYTAATAATTYTLTAPTPASGGVGVASASFAVALPANTTLANPVTITPNGGGSGGVTPASVVLTNAARSGAFTYTPATAGAKSIAAASAGALTDPPAVTYTANNPAATTYTLTAPTPASGGVGVASANFAVALPANTTLANPVTITPNDGGSGGTFTPASVVLTNAARSGAFTYTPATAGAKSIAAASAGALTNPPAVTYTANNPAAATTIRARALPPPRTGSRSRLWGR